MIVLDSTSEKIQIVLGKSVTTNQLEYTASYVDITTSSFTPGSSLGATNNTTAVDAVAAPGASTQRNVKLITLHNKDTVAQVVIVQKVATGGTRVLCKVTLGSLDTLQFTDGVGFTVLDDAGIENTSGITMGISAGTQSQSGMNTLVFSNSNGISFGLNTNNIMTMSTGGVSVSFWDIPCQELNSWTVTQVLGVHNIMLQRVYMHFYMTATRADMLGAFSLAGSTAASISQSLGVYTRNGPLLSLVSSVTAKTQWNSGGATSDTNSYSGVSGTRWRSFAPSSWAFTPGEYWFAWGHSVSSVGTGVTLTVFGQSTISPIGVPGVQPLNANSIGNEVNFYGIHGALLYASSAFPTIIGGDDIVWCHTAANGSAVFRQPYFRFFGTH